MRPTYYKPSGRTPLLIVPAFLGSLVLAIMGAFAYAWVNAPMHWSLSIITVWMFAGWLACVAKIACRLAKVRNPELMKEIGRAIGLIGWSAQWIFWIVLVSRPGVSDMPAGPMLVTLANLVSESGTIVEGFMEALDAGEWYEDPDAALLRSIGWILEPVILAMGASGAGRKQAGKPFCEASNRWARTARLRCRLAAEQVMRAPARLLADPEKLLAAMSSKLGRYRYASVTLYRMHKGLFVSIDLVDTMEDGRRHFRLKRNRVKYLSISRKAAHGFLQLERQRIGKDASKCKQHVSERLLTWIEDAIE
ncbi:hypothetical protein [Massilia sp. 9I]|uniref:hypothetical protein n=1 Tax=Massilia sp. 9I TaxID=2653152 RepID=UPI0012EF9180|nr:hypothetical protein [Massilia sp. 9I]VXA93589.1 conserved membrane hypothetical protein [Massilia sp. 9I]